MGTHAARPRHEKDPEPAPRKSVLGQVPYKALIAATLLVSCAVYYLTAVAPSLVPVPPDVSVPFPAGTRFLEKVCAWCGSHPFEVIFLALASLLPGFLIRFVTSRERYYVRLAILVGLATFFTYLSISAPIDRLLHAVEKAIPKDERVPAPNAPKPR